MMEFIIILNNRRILPAELRGFIVISLIIVLIIVNIFYYYKLQIFILQYKNNQSRQLIQLIDSFNQYKNRFTRVFYLLGGLCIAYVIVYFGGFILLLFKFHTPQLPPILNPLMGLIMQFLISSSFLLQMIYLALGWRHINRWRKSGRKLSEFENKISNELNFDD